MHGPMNDYLSFGFEFSKLIKSFLGEVLAVYVE